MNCSRKASLAQRASRSLNSSDRKSTRLNSSHDQISYAVFCLKKKKKNHRLLQGNFRIPFGYIHQGVDNPVGTYKLYQVQVKMQETLKTLSLRQPDGAICNDLV